MMAEQVTAVRDTLPAATLPSSNIIQSDVKAGQKVTWKVTKSVTTKAPVFSAAYVLPAASKQGMRRIPILRISCLALVLGSVACTQQERTDQLRERTADATAALKRDAKAVAQGIHEGWTRDNPLNLNTATKDQIQQLPGIDQTSAERIIASRPYRHTTDLVSRKVLAQAEYDKIKDRVKVK